MRPSTGWSSTIAFIALSVSVVMVHAQARPTATAPGSYIAIGGGFATFQVDYGRHDNAGGFVFADVNPQWRVGLEGEARVLRWHAAEQVTESTYFGGLRVAILRPHRFQPYGKFLAGVGKITLPFGYAHGSFLAYAPGGGLDIMLNDRVSIRALDFEYQRWPQFTYGAMCPYGMSAGISVRLNPISRYPPGR